MQAKAISPAAVNILQTLSSADNPAPCPCTPANIDVLPSRPDFQSSHINIYLTLTKKQKKFLCYLKFRTL